MTQPQPLVAHLPGDAPSPGASYQVPPGTAQAAELASLRPVPAPPRAEPELTLTDKLQQDADTPTAPPAWPEGAPELRPVMRLPFLERAEVMDLMAEVQRLAGAFTDATDDEDNVTPEKAARVYRAYAKLDELMGRVAVDRAQYEAWDGRWDDTRFTQLWAAYQARMNPGEASRSSS